MYGVFFLLDEGLQQKAAQPRGMPNKTKDRTDILIIITIIPNMFLIISHGMGPSGREPLNLTEAAHLARS